MTGRLGDGGEHRLQSDATHHVTDGRLVPAPSDGLLAEAVADPGALRALAEALVPHGVVVVGADRFGSHADEGVRVDPSVVALALAQAAPGLGVLVAVAATRDHPYNTARRVLSVDQLTGGRAGVLVGGPDLGTIEPSSAGDVWSDAPDDVDRAAEYVSVLRGLWNTWPIESIVADRASGVYADADRITSIDHDGSWSIRGPLGTPSSSQGEPVVAATAAFADVPGVEVVPELVRVTTPAEIASLPGAGAGAGVGGSLRAVLGLEPRRIDTSDATRAFWEAVR
jgi:alkanesulfonate monooxygenase SsuD/methylene tetrahydromethanopterin reductase-like flavin-dependent oxidoreductase (luciferase family)